MSHKRQDTFVRAPEWWKHLRPFNKRRLAKLERRAAAARITNEQYDENKTLTNPASAAAGTQTQDGCD